MNNIDFIYGYSFTRKKKIIIFALFNRWKAPQSTIKQGDLNIEEESSNQKQQGKTWKFQIVCIFCIGKKKI